MKIREMPKKNVDSIPKKGREVGLNVTKMEIHWYSEAFFTYTYIDRVATRHINTFENTNKISPAKRTCGSLSNGAVFGRGRKSLDEIPKNYYKIAQFTATYLQTAGNYLSPYQAFFFLFVGHSFFVKPFISAELLHLCI